MLEAPFLQGLTPQLFFHFFHTYRVFHHLLHGWITMHVSFDRSTPSLDTRTCPPWPLPKRTSVVFLTLAHKVHNLQQYRRISPGEHLLLNCLPFLFPGLVLFLLPPSPFPISQFSPHVPLRLPLLIRFRIWWHDMRRRHRCFLAPSTLQVVA